MRADDCDLGGIVAYGRATVSVDTAAGRLVFVKGFGAMIESEACGCVPSDGDSECLRALINAVHVDACWGSTSIAWGNIVLSVSLLLLFAAIGSSLGLVIGRREPGAGPQALVARGTTESLPLPRSSRSKMR